MIDPALSFEMVALPHLAAAYNLARWLLRDEQNAEDVVQEAYLRAFRFFKDVHGDDVRPWLLGIVRNACFDWLRQHRHLDNQVEFDELRDTGAGSIFLASGTADPFTVLERRGQGKRVNRAIDALAPIFREVIVLRELQEMPYEEIARVTGIPVGTVMSRLSRARAQLRGMLQGEVTAAHHERRA